jgi:hypothetical protein
MAKHCRVFPVAGPLRLRRMSIGRTLAEAATAAKMSQFRASYLERGLRIDPKGLALLEAAVEKLAARQPVTPTVVKTIAPTLPRAASRGRS